jgi:hypothetical protein
LPASQLLLQSVNLPQEIFYLRSQFINRERSCHERHKRSKHSTRKENFSHAHIVAWHLLHATLEFTRRLAMLARHRSV